MFMLPKAFSAALALICLTAISNVTFAQECGPASQVFTPGGIPTLQGGPFTLFGIMQSRVAAQNQFQQLQFQRQMLMVQQQRMQQARLEAREKATQDDEELEHIVREIEPRKKTRKSGNGPSADQRLQAALLKLERRNR